MIIDHSIGKIKKIQYLGYRKTPPQFIIECNHKSVGQFTGQCSLVCFLLTSLYISMTQHLQVVVVTTCDLRNYIRHADDIFTTLQKQEGYVIWVSLTMT